MTASVFNDGAVGTTGLEIAERLAGRGEFSLITLPEDRRKDDAARALKDLEAIVKDGVTKVDDMVAKKEEDIMKV